MARVVSYFLLALFAGLLLLKFQDPISAGILTGIATALLIPLIDSAIRDWRYVRLRVSTLLLGKREVRVSASGLIRLEVNAKFLLVRGARYPDQLQPVGGVFKITPNGRALLSKWRARSDDLIPIDGTSKDDLRIRVPASRLVAFVKWFEKGEGREIEPWREFHEELVLPGIVSSGDFPHLRLEFLRRDIRPLRFSPQAQCYELLIADIFAPVLSSMQERKLLQIDPNRTDVSWQSAEAIARLGAVTGQPSSTRIAPTAQWTL